MATISVKNLRKEFLTADGLVMALEDATFEASGHTFVSVVGPSGCGKSTLLNVLCGIDSPTSGTATITQDGHTARVGYVFQDARLLPWRTVMANMLFVQNDAEEETKQRCLHYLDMVGLSHATKNFPGQLSGGMQQRVAYCVGVLRSPTSCSWTSPSATSTPSLAEACARSSMTSGTPRRRLCCS